MFGYKKLLGRIEHLESLINNLTDAFELQMGCLNQREHKIEKTTMNLDGLNTMILELKGVIAQTRAQYMQSRGSVQQIEKSKVKRVYKKRKPMPEKDSQ